MLAQLKVLLLFMGLAVSGIPFKTQAQGTLPRAKPNLEKPALEKPTPSQSISVKPASEKINEEKTTTGAQREKEPSYYLCKHDKSVRTIRVVVANDNSYCRTQYAKSGVENTVAQAQHKQVCFNIMNNIRENLEGASWNCKDISGSRVSAAPMEIKTDRIEQ